MIGSAGCVQCIATERALEEKGIAFLKRDASDLTSEEADDLRRFLSAGAALRLPLVLAARTAWTGFRPDRIDQLTAVPKKGR